MKTIGSEPISAIKDIGVQFTKGGTELNVAFDQSRAEFIASFSGLTKREYFTAMAIQGLCANSESTSIVDIASGAVKIADATIAALNKEER